MVVGEHWFLPNLFGTQDMMQATLWLHMQIESEAVDGEFKEYDGEPREYTWSVNLELNRHSDDQELVVEEAKEAVRQTAPGYFVNLVTHEAHGHPENYLWHALDEKFDDLRYEFVDQCGCGGYVTRVHVE